MATKAAEKSPQRLSFKDGAQLNGQDSVPPT